MDNKLQDTFTQKMVEIYERAKTECDYTATRFYQMVNENGGRATAKKLLASTRYSEGLTRLWELKRLDISMEATILQESWCNLFESEELAVARRRLQELEYIVE